MLCQSAADLAMLMTDTPQGSRARGKLNSRWKCRSSYFEPKCYESISQSAGRSACHPRKVMWE